MVSELILLSSVRGGDAALCRLLVQVKKRPRTRNENGGAKRVYIGVKVAERCLCSVEFAMLSNRVPVRSRRWCCPLSLVAVAGEKEAREEK